MGSCTHQLPTLKKIEHAASLRLTFVLNGSRVSGQFKISRSSKACQAHFARMAEDDRTDFICPGCQAHYKVVRVKSGSRTSDWLLHCKVCKQPLAATNGEDILKYFLIKRPRARRRV
jgi:ribosomal protein L37AE/L43A